MLNSQEKLSSINNDGLSRKQCLMLTNMWRCYCGSCHDNQAQKHSQSQPHDDRWLTMPRLTVKLNP